MHFRERLASNNFPNSNGSGREALMAMRRQGSFLYREFKVPSKQEIDAAKISTSSDLNM
jgi:hypothetical protein